MKKVMVIVAALICALLIFTNDSFAAQAPRDGFRDVKWGDHIEKHPELIKIKKTDVDFDDYIKMDENLKIGTAELESIRYAFYNEKAVGVRVEFIGLRNMVELKAVLTDRYGEPYKLNQYLEEYAWRPIDGVFVESAFSSISNRGRFSMFQIAVLSDIKADRARRAKDAKKDF